MFIFNGPEAKASEEEIPPMEMPLSHRLGEMASATYETSGDITTIAKDSLTYLKLNFLLSWQESEKQGKIFKILTSNLMQQKRHGRRAGYLLYKL